MKRFTDKSGNAHTMDSLRSELELRDNQISQLEDKLIMAEHGIKNTQDLKSEVERIKPLEI